MDRVVFRDAEDRRGYITAQLGVHYSRKWEDAVEEYIERLEDEHLPETDEFPDERVYDRLVMNLPEELPIVEIERTDDPERSLR